MAGFRGKRNRTRSTRGRRLTRAEKIERAADCRHRRFRYRKRGLEAVCLGCGSVQQLSSDDGEVAVVRSWELELDDGEASSTAPALPHQPPPPKE